MAEDLTTTANHPQRLVLTGFMGSGKSTVGRALAERLGWRFLDLDEVVASREGMTVPEIFARRGEAAFRQAETAALADLLRETAVVVALGGGAPETPAVRSLLAAAHGTAVVHLEAPFDVLYERCVQQARNPESTRRPLLGDRAAAAERYQRRLPIYTEVAHHTAPADAGSPEAVVDSLLQQLGLRITSR